MKTPELKRQWALDKLRDYQVRLTPVREKVLWFLAQKSVPVTLSEISGSAELANQFDEATVYRTLALLVELEIARLIQFQGRCAHFVLNITGECFSFLVCRCCGEITPIPHLRELTAFEHRVSDEYGYSSLTHELELYGVCPDCREHAQHCYKPAKLVPGLRLRHRRL